MTLRHKKRSLFSMNCDKCRLIDSQDDKIRNSPKQDIYITPISFRELCGRGDRENVRAQKWRKTEKYYF